MDNGVPANKLVMGVASFGRKYSGISNTNNGLFQPSSSLPKTISYREILSMPAANKGKVFFDDVSKATYRYVAESGEWITYEDPKSIAVKMDYLNNKTLLGVMFWDVSYDAAEDSASLAQMVANKLKGWGNEIKMSYPVAQPQSIFCNIQGKRSSRRNDSHQLKIGIFASMALSILVSLTFLF